MGEVLTAIKDVIGGFQGLATVGLAVYGIHSWRRDFLGKRQIELAEETLALFYKAHDAVRAIRNPGSFASESDGRVRPEGEEPHQTDVRDIAYIVHKRIEQHDETFSKLHAIRYQVMARFGKDKGAPFEKMRGVVIQIAVAANSYVRVGSNREIVIRRAEFLRKHESVFWQGLEDNDPLQAEVDAIMVEIEGMMRPIIDRAATEGSWLVSKVKGWLT